jgi:hypothetical protein
MMRIAVCMCVCMFASSLKNCPNSQIFTVNDHWNHCQTGLSRTREETACKGANIALEKTNEKNK